MCKYCGLVLHSGTSASEILIAQSGIKYRILGSRPDIAKNHADGKSATNKKSRSLGSRSQKINLSRPGSRYAWWLKFVRIDQRECVILDASAVISQISNAKGLEGVVDLFPYFGGTEEIGCLYFLYLLGIAHAAMSQVLTIHADRRE